MKKLIVLFVSVLQLSSACIYSQNYECIKENTINHFFIHGSKPILSIKIDSTKIYSNKAVYYNYSWKRQIENVLFINGASWLGDKIENLNNDNWLFYNARLDTIKIKSSAILNENWIFYKFLDGSKIIATITNIDTLSLFGVNDSVKYINLQKVDAVNSNIASVYDNQAIILSKNYGLIATFPFYYFDYQEPDNSYLDYNLEPDSIYQLIGMSNPEIGWQNITARDIYNFNVGDEHHTYRDFQCPIPPIGNLGYFEKRKILKYLSKTFSSNNDTVKYSAERCLYEKTFYNDGTPTNYSFTHDTISEEYVLSNQYIDDLSYEFSCYLNGNASSPIKYKTYITNNNDVFANCDDTTQYLLYDGGAFTTYYPNLGHYSTINTFPNGNEGEYLVYSKVNAVEYGTPYSCSELEILAINTPISKTMLCNVYPNPAKDKLFVQLENKSGNYIVLNIYNTIGKVVISESIDLQSPIIDVSNLNNGIYFYNLVDINNNISISGKVVIQK